MKNEATSVFQIWWRTRTALKQKNSWNTKLPILICVLILISDSIFLFSSRDMIKNISSTLLQFNGSLLGFTIAGFGIFQSIPKSILNHAVGTQAEDYPWSFYKLMLLNYLHVLFVTFLGVCILIGIYFLSFITDDNLTIDVSNYLRCLNYIVNLSKFFNCILLAGIIFVQMMIMVKLKVFLFWIYDNSLMLAMSAATKDHAANPVTMLPPFDKRND